MTHENIWVADESMAKSAVKTKVYNYISDLNIQSDKLCFAKNDLIIPFSSIDSIKLGRQRIPYLTYVIVAFSVFLSVLGQSKSLAYAAIPLLIGVMLGLSVGYGTRWVIIIFDNGNSMKRLYLADGRLRGWRGVFGGTRNLFLELENQIKTWNKLNQTTSAYTESQIN